ncbi:cytochrome c biogenesis heme-transporting ATPase CcmA [Enterobacteriaceae bacterium YMB-R22]|jgi:heme exporter protein A|uniref:cytochrome c biogenesis heme-transporting ATPase CcmA n=1 Tax=Tenebrionicola larvae TaxID=2815733 RepID=UPI002011CF1F|nr:cytochrome c biogenesis heme-transporting ATPase CcmA [Tenebrionicola larvae]MBV4411848.1 cytochrome c biogenesis heme-transporting ATPase CcmA [Tenebrionicola larvae]
MLDAQKLTCVRDERVLFSVLSFSVAAGEVVQIVGANGAGKTSLLRILSGLASPQAGHVRWRGELINRVREDFHRELLWLGHQPGVKNVMTADENLRFFHPSCSQDARWQALACVGMAGYEDVPVAQMSAGQQRRVALARLWLSRASLWILDEPFTALDVAGVEKLTRCFERHAGQGGSVLLTSHQALRPLSCPLRNIALTQEEATQ